MIRLSIELLGISLNAARRREMFSACITYVGLRRANIVHVGGGLNPLPMYADRARWHRLRVRLFQQILNPSLGLVILTLAEVFVANLSFGVDEVVGGPILIMERVPDRIIAVESN